jgi:hypothetical protein
MLTFEISRFTLNHGTLVAEASSLQIPPNQYPTFTAIKNMDGSIVDYTFEKQDRDMNAQYRAITPTGCAASKYVGLTIFND